MNVLLWITAHPIGTRLIVFVVALCVARLINWAIISQSVFTKPYGPWVPAPGGDKANRTWQDWLPVWGWWRLRREDKVHGRGFWLRPFLIELVFPLAMVWMYDAYTAGKLLPLARLALTLQAELHSQFIGHFILIALMTVATFIDFDEQLIPDSITIPGTLVGLIGSATMPAWLPLVPSGLTLEEMHATTFAPWPASFNQALGLAICCAIVTVWCFALLDRVWITRRGLNKAFIYLFATIFRSTWWIRIGLLWVVTLAGVILFWQFGSPRWPYFMSSLMGLAFAGGITWAVRVAAGMALRVEALGFGDVTLMAMIGTYIGWQPSLLVFFVAPLVAVVVFGLRRVILGDGAGPYGPYLCGATLVVLLYWEFFERSFALPILELPPRITFLILGVAVVLLGAMLTIYKFLVGKVRGLSRY